MWSLSLSIMAIVISIVSPITAVIIYKKSILFAQKLHDDKSESDRVKAVVDKYVDLANKGKDSGIGALVRAGIKNLKSEQEISKALSDIANQVGKHPLGCDQKKVEDAGLLRFFEMFEFELFKNGGADAIIERLKKTNNSE